MHAQNPFFWWGTPFPSVYVDTDVIHMIKYTRSSPSVFAYCKWSKTGRWEALGTKLTLAYNTQQITKFLAIQPIRCCVWHPENLLHQSTLQVMTSCFCAIIATHVLASITSSKLCEWSRFSVCPHVSRVYLMSTLDITHVMKCTRLSPSLAGRAWEWGYTRTFSVNTVLTWNYADSRHLAFIAQISTL